MPKYNLAIEGQEGPVLVSDLNQIQEIASPAFKGLMERGYPAIAKALIESATLLGKSFDGSEIALQELKHWEPSQDDLARFKRSISDKAIRAKALSTVIGILHRLNQTNPLYTEEKEFACGFCSQALVSIMEAHGDPALSLTTLHTAQGFSKDPIAYAIRLLRDTTTNHSEATLGKLYELAGVSPVTLEERSQ